MSGKVNTNQITLTVQTVEITPTLYSLRNLRSCHINYVFATKQRIDCSSFISLITVAITHQSFQENFSFGVDSKVLFTFQFRKTVKATGQREAFHVLLIAGIQIDTLHKVENSGKRTVLFTFLHDTLHGSLAYSFYGSKPETDITVTIYSKLQVTLIDIRSQGLNTHRLTFIHQLRDIRNVRQTSAHHSRHIFGRIIRFQIGSLISHP